MPSLIPPPAKTPKSKEGYANYLRSIYASVYQIFDAIGGADGVPKIFNTEDNPASYDASNPDGFFKVIAEDGSEKVIPYWNV